MPRIFDDVAECVESTLSRVGSRIVLALPLGIGKPNPLANEFYHRARRDPALSLTIFTALSLRAPPWNGELERRFLEPLVARLFGGGVPLAYVTDLHAAGVPQNVRTVGFFLAPAPWSMLGTLSATMSARTTRTWHATWRLRESTSLHNSSRNASSRDA